MKLRRAVVLAHYDRDDLLDEYVRHLIVSLKDLAETLVVVSTASLDSEAKEFLNVIGARFIVRENRGYDFASYKAGLESLDIDEYDELVLCNDSVYGPFRDMAPIFEHMRDRESDFWGLTENYEFSRHIQSYFIVFTKNVLKSEQFLRFWAELRYLPSKSQVIRQCEVGLSKILLEAGFEMSALVSSENNPKWKRVSLSWRQYIRTLMRRWREPLFWSDALAVVFFGRQIGINPTHMEWLSLMKNYRLPFLKIELLRDNPKGLDNLDEVTKLIGTLGDYPTELVDAHLTRISGERRKK